MGAAKICRFREPEGGPIRLGVLADDEEQGETLRDARSAGFESLGALVKALGSGLDEKGKRVELARWPRYALSEVELLAPIDRNEVWAAGVTYFRSKAARMEESDFGASAYDRVYDAPRPELFFKSLPEKVVGPYGEVGIREDARWSVPEPELALVADPQGGLIGCTIGNDMSSRDIEGENLLYLPQAKVYRRSCALGPVLLLETDEAKIRQWSISLQILREGKVVFEGETGLDQIKRSLDALVQALYRCQDFPHGAVLLTGTGVVPPDDFTLREGDRIGIEITGIGRLENTVVTVR